MMCHKMTKLLSGGQKCNAWFKTETIVLVSSVGWALKLTSGLSLNSHTGPSLEFFESIKATRYQTFRGRVMFREIHMIKVRVRFNQFSHITGKIPLAKSGKNSILFGFLGVQNLSNLRKIVVLLENSHHSNWGGGGGGLYFIWNFAQLGFSGLLNFLIF